MIQSESASQTNVIGNTVTITTTLCASNAAAAAPCSGAGNSNTFPLANTTAPGQLLVGYRIPVGVVAPPTITTSVPGVGENGGAISTPVNFTASAGYAAGLSSIAPPPAGSYWVGYVSDTQSYATSSGPQSIALSPTFTLPAGFTGAFTWRTVVGYRSPYYSSQGDVTCPGVFPGAQTPVAPIPGQASVCVDYPDAATIAGPPSSYATAGLALTAPATVTVVAGGTATLTFAALLSGSNPAGGIFGSSVATTLPGVTPSIIPAQFAPAADSQTNLGVSLAVPATTPPGTYDVAVTTGIAGLNQTATAQITVTAPVPITATASATGSAAKLTLAVRKTSLKVARKTGVSLTITLSKRSSVSLVAVQAKPKVSVTIRKTLTAGKKTVVLVKSARFHKGRVTITFKGGGLTRTSTVTLR